MLYWDYIWGELKNELDNLDGAKRFKLALSSLEYVLEINFVKAMLVDHANEGNIIDASVNVLHGLEYGQFKILYEKIETEVDPDIEVVLDYVFTSLTILLRSKNSRLSLKDTYGVLSYSYQVVLHNEILSCLPTTMSEDEVRGLEEKNIKCQELINKQIDMFRSLKHQT
ncbi:MAG: hypothetical protein MI864_28445 [Pseudomonadales bacterium]|nr:hypothetical protein [Pseudomonadales bacterium]